MALTVAELAQRPEHNFAWLFVIDGIRHMWSNVLDLCGTGPGTWLGEDHGDRVVLLGHGVGESMVPDEIGTGIDLDSGMLRDGSLDITITDRDGVLIELMREPDDRDFFAARISPLDDPAPPTVIGYGGDNIDVHGRCIGAETIGPDGERHMYPCIPGSTLPGLDHAAIDSSDTSTLAPSTVTDAPEMLSGRRCALYVIRRDTTTGLSGPASYPSWQDQMDSGYSLVWWGTVQRVTTEAHVFRFACDGPDSWLRRPLNVTSPSEWRPLSAPLRLRTGVGEREDLMAISTEYKSPFDTGDNKHCAVSLFDTTDDVIGNDQGPHGVLADIAARLTTLAAASGDDEVWTTYRNSAFNLSLDGLSVRTDDDSPAVAAIIRICLHEKVWRFLGWDCVVQARTIAEIESNYDVAFKPCPEKFKPWEGASSPVPGPGYYEGFFSTIPIGLTSGEAGADVDNGGAWRGYQPLTTAGVTMLFPEGKQEVSLGFGSSPYWTGQLARPVADHTMTGADPCDRTGFIVLRGPYRASLEEEPRTIYQVAKISWTNQGETFAENSEGQRTVYIEKYLDGRLFGLKDPPITQQVWSSSEIEWTTIGVVGYRSNDLDCAHLVLQRLLLSAGGKVWDTGAFEDVDGATSTPGTNTHPDVVAPFQQGDDQDIADLGLAIPHELVDWRSFLDAANALPAGGWKSPLNRVKIAYQGSFDSQELIEQLIRPRAWMLSLHGYKYGAFSFASVLDADDATVVITEADLDSPSFPYIPSVDLQPLSPFDSGSLEYGFAATTEGGETVSEPIKPLSTRARARHGNATLDLSGRGLVDTRLWIGDPVNKGPAPWLTAFRSLWNTTMAEFLLGAHEMIVGLPVRTPKANSINPGTIVLISNAWPATRTGQYGMTARVGRVTSVRRSTQNLTAICDILVQAGDANSKRRFSPLAAILDDVDTLEERHDPATRTLFCYADRFGAEGSSDVGWFVPPAWSQLGGDALVYGFSFDGRSWTKRFQFQVESVDTTAHTITYKAGTFSGTFREREYHVLTLAPHADQTAAWAKALYLVTTDSTGKFGGVKGFPLVT